MAEVLDRALMVHAQIKKRLCEAIRTPGLVDPDEIKSDRTCAFGLWIYGHESHRFWGFPQFHALKGIHAKFHEAAYQAAMAVKDGRVKEAEASIAAGDFELASQTMKHALIELKAVNQVQQKTARGGVGA